MVQSTSPMNDPSNLLLLVSLISKAVVTINQEYLKAGSTLPRLEDTSLGPLDTPESMTPELSRAIQTLEAACAQLSFTVASPGHVITNKAMQFEESASFHVIVEARIADLLMDKPAGLHVDELAERSGLDADKLGRILRLLATKHCFSEVKPNVFANNRLSVKLISTDPVASLIGHLTDECFRAASHINDALADSVSGHSMSPDHSPFLHAYGVRLFDFYEHTDPHVTDRFNKAMIGFGMVTGKGMLPRVYPWASFPEGTTICDIGGGNGHVTLDLIKKFPQLRVVLQDLPHVVEEGRKLWTSECPELVENEHVRFIPMDFLKAAPVSDSDFYYLRHILHDWPRAECLEILRYTKSAMKPNSRLLVNEFVLQHATRADDEMHTQFAQAPEPLLPNFGMGRVRMYQQDMTMLCMHNSKERTLEEFIDMGSEAGLKFVKLWDAGETSLVEFRTI